MTRPFAMASLLAAALILAACPPEGPPADDVDERGEGEGEGNSGEGEGEPSEGEGEGEGEPAVPVPGLLATYYAGYHDPVLSRVEATLDQDWASASPDAALGVDFYSARWTGFLTAPETGTYTLITDTDDGVRVFVDGQLVIDDWHGHFVARNTAELQLTAGRAVPLVVEYFELDILASARLSWASATIAEQVVPTSALTTIDVPSELRGPTPPYSNPVVGFDCPDPGVIEVPDAAAPGFYMVCTGGSFPVRYSRDLVRWSDTTASILPAGKPAWAANGGRNWAPEIHRVGDKFVAYFTTVNAADKLCVATAVADDILGPYTEAAGPLVEHPFGVIDATTFEANGVRYLVYKIDGNSVGQPTPMFVRRLSADGLSFAAGSGPVQVLTNDPSTWEGGVVEAPFVVERDGTFFMFYSGNVYNELYRTGVARAPHPLGPWEKKGAPILANNERFLGPGHGTVLHVGDDDYFFYHAWNNNGAGLPGPGGRQGLVDRIDWVDGWPTIGDGTPSRSALPYPGE